MICASNYLSPNPHLAEENMAVFDHSRAKEQPWSLRICEAKATDVDVARPDSLTRLTQI